MTWQNAQAEAARRIRALDLPHDGRLDGLTVTLLDFENDAVAMIAGGGGSFQFQRMVNRAVTRQLENRGAAVKIRKITQAETLDYKRSTL